MLGWVDPAGAQQTGRNGQNDDVCEFPENRPSNPEYRDVRDSALQENRRASKYPDLVWWVLRVAKAMYALFCTMMVDLSCLVVAEHISKRARE